MNIRDLQYLIAVAETSHFGQAAERCFVSQPTLSAQLKKLEEALGVILFERTNRSVMITPIGQRILAEAKIIIHHTDKIKKLANNSKDPFSATFRVGIIPTLGPYLLPYILPAIKLKLPRLELILYENKTDIILTELREGRLDAVILALPVKLDGLVQKLLFREPFYMALPKNHSLATKDSVNMREIEHETLLLLEEGHCLREQALEACKFSSGNYSTDFSATSLETLRQIVSLGVGVTLMPALAVKGSTEKGIVIKPISGAVPTREVGMLWRQAAVSEPCCLEMVKIIHQHIKKCKEIASPHRTQLLTKPLG